MNSLELKAFATVLASEEGFSGGPRNSSFKKPLTHNNIFEHIKKKIDKSLKNRQVQEKVQLELGKTKFKRCHGIDARPRKNTFDASCICTSNCSISTFDASRINLGQSNNSANNFKTNNKYVLSILSSQSLSVTNCGILCTKTIIIHRPSLHYLPKHTKNKNT